MDLNDESGVDLGWGQKGVKGGSYHDRVWK